MPIALRGRPCLTDDEARALASVACRIEDHYGAAQDIEWALLGESPDHPALHGEPADRIAVLQSRPETVWVARDAGPVDPADLVFRSPTTCTKGERSPGWYHWPRTTRFRCG